MNTIEEAPIFIIYRFPLLVVYSLTLHILPISYKTQFSAERDTPLQQI